MSTPVKTAPPTPAEASNRVQVSWTTRLLGRPEIGALVAAIVIFIFFLIVAPAFRTPAAFFTVLYQASTIGIVAVGVGMLMIGGEFDLSAGVLVFSAGLLNGMLCYQLGLNLWVGAISRAHLLPGCRLPQWLPGDAHRHSQLPDHAGHVLHPARRQPRRNQTGYRIRVEP